MTRSTETPRTESLINATASVRALQAPVRFDLTDRDAVAFLEASTDAILEMAPDDDDARVRRIYFATIVTLFRLQVTGQATSSFDLSKSTGAPMTYVARLIKPLVDGGLVTVVETGNSATLTGHGRLNHYYVSARLIERTQAGRALSKRR